MRLSKNISQVFYIQPFFKDLFLAVTQLYNIQQKSKEFEKFTCYRGGFINSQELKNLQNNLGKFVQNLGFLSTSLNKQQAQVFTKNVLF